MLRAYLRIVLFVAGLIGAAILFAFAFSAAAVVLLVTLVMVALFGRPPNVQWWVVRDDRRAAWNHPRQDQTAHKEPLTIDHDPNDLPRG